MAEAWMIVPNYRKRGERTHRAFRGANRQAQISRAMVFAATIVKGKPVHDYLFAPDVTAQGVSGLSPGAKRAPAQ